MRTLKIDDIAYSIPSEWNELAIDHLLHLAALTSSSRLVEEIKTKMLLNIMGATVYMLKQNPEGKVYKITIDRNRHFLTSEDIARMNSYMDFLFIRRTNKVDGIESESIYLNPQLYVSPWERLPCGCAKNLIHAGKALSNILMNEVSYLLTIHASMSKDFAGNINKLVGILFRDRNHQFDPGKIDSYAADAGKASDNVKLIAYWYYVGSMNFIASKFKNVFKSDTASVTVGNVFTKQMELTIELAGNDVTKVSEVGTTPYYTVLYRLEKTNKEAEKQTKRKKNGI